MPDIVAGATPKHLSFEDDTTSRCIEEIVYEIPIRPKATTKRTSLAAHCRFAGHHQPNSLASSFGYGSPSKLDVIREVPLKKGG